MMFHYWKKKGIRPSVFYSMDKGELTLLRAFFELEIEEELNKQEALKDNPMGAMLALLMS